jgi:hypothetical protein
MGLDAKGNPDKSAHFHRRIRARTAGDFGFDHALFENRAWKDGDALLVTQHILLDEP